MLYTMNSVSLEGLMDKFQSLEREVTDPADVIFGTTLLEFILTLSKATY